MDRRSAFIALALALNLAGPLRYYLGVSHPFDERFAWRMFSPIRMLRCTADYRVAGEPVELGEHFHAAWITLLERGRPDVARAATERICRINPGREVTLDYRCTGVGDAVAVLETPDHDVCGGVP